MPNNIKIIAEIGINHNGSYKTAKNLILASKASNIDAIKFQYRNLESTYSNFANREIGDEILIGQIKKNHLSPEEIIELCQFAHSLELGVGISFFNTNDISDFKSKIDEFDFFKLPSAELTNIDLIQCLLGKKKHLYISTGAHMEGEIEQVFNKLPKDGWTPLHCISNYPSKTENAKLGYISYLAKKWDRDVGYSSHDEFWEVCLLAIYQGANTIEPHITFDKLSDGLDHSSSSTPEEFHKLTEVAKNIKTLGMGDAVRVPNQGERLNRQNLGRSYFLVKDCRMGHKISLDDVEYKSPNIGITKSTVHDYLGKAIQQPVRKGASLTPSLFKRSNIISKKQIDFANLNNISLPVRFHDYELISRVLPINTFELHLSYEETLSMDNSHRFDENQKFSIHLPDYINTNQLIDPFSESIIQKELSLKIIEKVANLAQKLQDKTGEKVPVVGSFSLVGESKPDFYQKIAGLVEEFSSKDVFIFPQWLPPVAWYFGGSVNLDSFCKEEDANYISELKIPICMDFCHLFMGQSYFGFSSAKLLNNLSPLINHMHISEASGFDGEGMQFGEGEKDQGQIIGNFINSKHIKVIEVWQGHLDQGAGFREAIERLEKFYG